MTINNDFANPFDDPQPAPDDSPKLADSIYDSEGQAASSLETDLRSAEAVEAAPLVSVRKRRRVAMNFPVVAAIILLSLATAFFFGSSRGALPVEVITWWPLVILVIALLWLVGALFRRRAPGTIGAAGLTGIGLSLLLATAYQVPLGSTLIGVTFITLGAGVILRGLFMRPLAIR